jgi:predicted transcriptional regulator
MDKIEYFKNRKNALRFIYNNKNGDVSTFLASNDEFFLKEFIDMGFIEVDKTTNTYEITRLGKDYVDEFYN